jgi:ABC-type transport system involved in multi-copper enzyme maturation permease subunit
MPQTRSTSPFLRLGVAFTPLTLCIALAWAVTAGPLGFGGGEKDIILAFPLAALSLVFALVSLALWAFRASLARASKVAALVSLVVLVVALLAFVFVTWR